MDKIDTALTATEDNAAAIRALSNKLNAQAEKIEQLSSGLTGKIVFGVANAIGTTFGELESDGTQCALIHFGNTDRHKVYFCKRSIAYSYSPVFVKIPAGRGELETTAPTPARVLLFAPNTILVQQS